MKQEGLGCVGWADQVLFVFVLEWECVFACVFRQTI